MPNSAHWLVNLVNLTASLSRMKRSYSIGEAKTHLSKLVAEAERGEPVELRRGQTPVARLVPVTAPDVERRAPGALAGQIEIRDDFDMLPDDVARALGVLD